jgi:hypothetical protein
MEAKPTPSAGSPPPPARSRKRALRSPGSQASLDDQNRTVGHLHDPIGAASDQPLVERGVPGRADHHQIGTDFRRQIDNEAHRTT